MLNQAYAHTHTHAHTNRCYVGKRWDLSAVLKDEADWENLIFFGSVFQRARAKKEKERSPYDFVLTDHEMECTVYVCLRRLEVA